MLKEKHQKEIDDILSRYPVRRSALLPLLYLAQREQGYVTEAAMKEIAQILKLTPPQVYETITFYTMLNLKPVGKFHIQVCKSLMCALVGSDQLVGWFHAKLGIKPGETTPDKHDADQRRLLRTADGAEGGPDSVRSEKNGGLPAQGRSLHVAGTDRRAAPVGNRLWVMGNGLKEKSSHLLPIAHCL